MSTPFAVSAPPEQHQAPVLCLAGPTASGKTAAAVHVAQALGAEIVSVDSALVYRGMDVGTAKPRAAERGGVVHHLIDIREVTEPYSAAEFAREAARCMAEIRSRGGIPLLVGGTMLYFKALLDGLHELPATDPAVRASVAQHAAERGWPALHAELAQVDAATAARLAPNDSQRIGRALEVWRQTGKSLSNWTAQPLPQSQQPLRPAFMVSLEPSEAVGRSWLHERIAQRFDVMLAAGLVDEVRALMARPGVHADLPALRAVGYRQVIAALQADTKLDAQGLARLREQGIAATRQLAKRQLTWLRSLPSRQVVAAEAPDAAQQVLRLMQTALRRAPQAGPQP